MLDWIKQFSGKLDHPLRDAKAAQDLIAELPKGVSIESLEQISHWVESVKDTPGFACDDRLAVIRLLDQAGAPHADFLFNEFFSRIHQLEKRTRSIWDVLCTYWGRLAEAYAGCVADFEHGEKGANKVVGDMPLAAARALRAANRRFKLRHLRFVRIDAAEWAPLYRLYALTELKRFDDSSVVAYAREVHTTVRAELQKIILLYLAAPHEFPPAQLELSFRVLERFAISAAWSRVPQDDCNFVFNLSAGGPPAHMPVKEAAGASRRFIGGGPALSKLAELRQLCEQNMLSEEQRFGKEFSPAQIITVIKHLQRYLSVAPPHRRYARARAAAQVSVVHGLKPICQRVTKIELGSGVALSEDMDLKAKTANIMKLVAEEVESTPETWVQKDQSEWGLGADIPPELGKWAEPGKLCGIQFNGEKFWCVGIVRRIDSDATLHCGIRIFSKRPVSVWLRVLGVGEHQADNWASSTGSFSFDYLRAIMLPDALKSHDHPVMILENKRYVPGQLCEVMMGEHSRQIKLMEFIEEGEDYVRAAFEWQQPAKG
ncbi:MAG: hypothetical protein D4R74_11040 [Betaproteobacteria bacterium]|nr:MAG: hypothetical protein D4R74_11040 [Betaproteobacteria bacterium]